MSLFFQNKSNKGSVTSQTIYESCVFAMLASIMFCSKLIMELLPNIHLLGMLTMAYTVAFRFKALIPIYLYVIINGIYAGFSSWWVGYIYIWAILWGVTMLVPKRVPKKLAAVIYPIICALHGFAFGILYAPAQALMFGFNFEQTVAWVVSGFPFDIIHGISNFATGMLVLPLSELLKRLMKKSMRR